MTLVVRDDADVLDAQIAFHLNAGVDFVIATDHESRDGSADILESYARDGYLERIPASGEDRNHEWRTDMARHAVGRGADWVIDAEVDEFWLPRAESLKDVLLAIPPRYGVVQGLTRVFLPRPGDGGDFAERMTVRRGTYSPEEESAGRLDWALRHVYRASPSLVVGPDRETALDGRVPLRAWYPIEVLRFPLRDREQAERRARGRSGPPSARSRIELRLFGAGGGTPAERWNELVVSDDELARGAANGSLVLDERLRDALRGLESASQGGGLPRRFALPADGAGHLVLPVPNVVDDVAYAGECAAVREVDFEPLVERIGELEERIRILEARLWPRLRRQLYRLVRRTAP